MNRMLFSMVGILVCMVVEVQGFSSIDAKHIGVAIKNSTLEDQLTFSGPSGGIDPSAIKVVGSPSLRPFFPSIQKFSFIGLASNEDAGLQVKGNLSRYVFYTQCHIIRLEGEDIIHPFNYFW